MKLYQKPQTKQRPRLGKRRKVYTPKTTADYEKQVRQAWIDQEGWTQYTGPVGLSLIIRRDHIEVDVWELAESHRPKGNQGDLDNFMKAVGDGLAGAAYLNDRQIHYLDIRFEKDEVDGGEASSTDQVPTIHPEG